MLTMVLSLLGHVGFGYFAGKNLVLPDLEIEMQIPIDVELGLNEEIEAAPSEPVPPVAAADDPKKAAAGAGDAGVDAAVDAAVDASGRDARVERDADDAGGDASPGNIGDGGATGSRLPPGAQIALRVDMTRIRQSPVVEDVRALLQAVPDWQALLDGSGIDPVAQLDRLLIMTPNLQREKVSLAGRYIGDRQVVLDAVQNLAQARGVEAKWRTQRGVQVAPWANADTTPRVIALVGPQHFTISREEDLERVLAIAAARAKKARKLAQDPSAADALLSMEEQEGLSLEVDGAEQFVRRGRRGIPQRLRLSATENAGTSVELRGRLSYADEAAASDALAFWQQARDGYARNALIGLLGLASVLQDATIEQQQLDLNIKLTLSVQQTRLILGYARELLGKRAAPKPP